MPPPWTQRMGWFVLIWALSVAALAGFALVFRVVMHAVGLTG